MDAEVLITAGYGAAMVLAALIVEWLSARTHHRSLRYRTNGFEYSEEHDHWICPEGEHLWPHEYDHERRFVRYRAKASICNGCPVKEKCTDSDSGREIVRPVDPWPHSEAGRFHRGIAVLLVVIGLLILVVGALRSGGSAAALVLFATLICVATVVGVLLARDLAQHKSGFPDGAGVASPRVAHVGADGRRPATRWASERRGVGAEGERW